MVDIGQERGMGPVIPRVAGMMWKVLEEMYLESATDQERAAYRGMTMRQKWGVLEPFLRSRARPGKNPWLRILVERLGAKARAGRDS